MFLFSLRKLKALVLSVFFFISSLKKRIKYFEGNESLNKKKQQHANHAEFSGLEEVIIKIEM